VKKHDPHIRNYNGGRANSASVQSVYQPDHRKYSSTVDNYEPLHHYQGSNEFKLISLGGSESYESKVRILIF
jgi:hypothetical protein